MQKYLAIIAFSIILGICGTRGYNPKTGFCLECISESQAGIEIKISLEQVMVQDITIKGTPMHRVTVPGLYHFNCEGSPNLPGTGRYIALPQGAKARITILSKHTEIYKDIDLVPAPGIFRDPGPSPSFNAKDLSIYQRDILYPDLPVRVSRTMKMRGIDVVILGITPFQYNPVHKELVVYKDLHIRVDFIGGTGYFGQNRLRSPYWEPILAGHLLNYKSLPRKEFSAPVQRDGYEYIIITPDDSVFIRWADTIKLWRKLQGITTEIFTLTDIGGSSAQHIETFIDSAYNNWSIPPVAVLLLSDYPSSGDIYGITSPVWNGHCISDNIYADIDNDDLPDLVIARICAQTGSHLEVMIHKFLNYERNPYTSAQFYDNPLITTHWQTERWPQLTAEIIRGFWMNILSKNPVRQYQVLSGTPVPGCAWSTAANTDMLVAYYGSAGLGYIPDNNPNDATWWNNGTPEGINTAINAGTFLFENRLFLPYQTQHLYGLINDKYPFAILITADGNFSGINPCFTEVFHRLQHGALGCIAPSGPGYGLVNDIYNLALYDGLWSEFHPDYPGNDLVGYCDLRPGFANVSAKYYLAIDNTVPNPQYKPYVYHLYHMHGDAFTILYSEMPQTLAVSHAPTGIPGQTYFTVTANDSSVIALTVQGEIIGVAEGTGMPLNITIPPQTPGTIMKVTVTKANYFRYQQDVPFTSGSHYLLVSTVITNDTLGGNGNGIIEPGETIHYGVWALNTDPPTSYEVYGLMEENDQYMTMNLDSSWYADSIAPFDSALSNPYYIFSIANNCPNGHYLDLSIHLHDTLGVYVSYPAIIVYAPVLVYKDHTISGGNGNGLLEPGETADIIVTITNEGGAPAVDVAAYLHTNSAYITIEDSLSNYGTVSPGDTVNNSADVFTVTADSTTPAGTYADFQMLVQSGSYIDTISFSTVIGKKHYYIWNPEPTPTPGENMHATLSTLGYLGDYGSNLAPDLDLYLAVFVCCGVYPNNYIIQENCAEAMALEDYLQSGGRFYLEGGDVWYWDPLYGSGHDFSPWFGIRAYADAGPPVCHGVPGTFTRDMIFQYGGENSYLDCIAPTATGFLIFTGDNLDSNGVANDAVIYRTVGINSELGLLIDSIPPSTRAALLDSIMHFFGIFAYPGIDEYASALIPDQTKLQTIFPNPTARATTIAFQIAEPTKASINIYDAAGRLVKTLFNDDCAPGIYSIDWSGRDTYDRDVPSGIYFIRFQTNSYVGVKKLIFLK